MIARIFSVFARCPRCQSRLRYRTATGWRCANCGARLTLPKVN